MTNYISNAPLWVIILFVACFLYSIYFIAKQVALSAGITPDKSRNIGFGIFGFYVLYLAYVSTLALKGAFFINPVPPKVMVFAAIPLAIILFAIIGNTSLFKKILRSITLESLIIIHVFRLLGVFFFILYFYRLLPTDLAFSAGTGDILTALFAWPVAKWVSEQRSWSIKAVYAWNIFGILDIVSLLIIVGITIKKSVVSSGNGGLQEMTIFPFAWFPAFAPATILFLHSVVFRKLQQIKAT